jgi:hypothetical protein
MQDKTISEINKQLMDTAHSIQTKSNEIEEARGKYLSAKTEYEYKYALAIDTLKVTQPDLTITDLKSKAEISTHQLRLDMNVADSLFHKLKADINALRDTLEALQEISYNTRQEIKLSGYQDMGRRNER